MFNAHFSCNHFYELCETRSIFIWNDRKLFAQRIISIIAENLGRLASQADERTDSCQASNAKTNRYYRVSLSDIRVKCWTTENTPTHKVARVYPTYIGSYPTVLSRARLKWFKYFFEYRTKCSKCSFLQERKNEGEKEGVSSSKYFAVFARSRLRREQQCKYRPILFRPGSGRGRLRKDGGMGVED